MTASREESRSATRTRVENVISGGEGLRGVHWLLSGGESFGTIRRVLSGMIESPGLLGHCRLIRAKFYCGQKFLRRR